MPTTLRSARVAAVLTVVASVLGAGPVRGLTGEPETDATTALPAVADPETAAGDELADSLRAFDEAVVTLAEEASEAEAARAAAIAELEDASEAHGALAQGGDHAAAVPASVSEAASTTDMFRTLNVRTPAATSLGGALSAGGGAPDELEAAARAEAEAAAEADRVAADAEAAAAVLAEAEAAESDVIASVESRLVDALAEADDVAADDAADADAEAVRAEAATIAESLEEVEASRAAREAAALAATTDPDDAPATAEEDEDEADAADEREGRAAPAAGTSETAAAPAAPEPAPAPAPPPAPAPLPDPTGSVSGVLAAVWCADGRQIIVDGSIGGNVQQLVNDAQAAGIGICAKSGFRSYHEQVELRRAHCGGSDYAIFQAPPSTCSPPTARPGTSNHEGGLAIDFSCFDGQPMTHASPCYQWLAGNAARYGLHNLPSEPWHWSVTGR